MTHRWQESTSDAGEIVESNELQPPEAIIYWDGLEAPDVRPRPSKWLGALIASVVLVALGCCDACDFLALSEVRR